MSNQTNNNALISWYYAKFTNRPSLTCIQHFSGFTFTKKFLLQVLKTEHQPNHLVNSTLQSNAEESNQNDPRAYCFAMLINFLRFLSNLLMAKCLISYRIRFLYFVSLASTSIVLVFLGILLKPHFLEDILSTEVHQLLKVTTLALHVICVQFGVQTLAGQLTDVLLP